MTKTQIVELQRRVGAEPDGFWGPKSIAACQKYLRALMPKPNPWPAPDDAAMTRFFGKAGDESNLVSLPVEGLCVMYDRVPVKAIRCHKKISEPLLAALREIHAGPAAWVLREYAGCFNYRSMRGAARLSKHAWGAAIDLAPGTNGLNTAWPVKANMPIEAIEAFAKVGFLSAAAFWGRDGMHFQSTT
jgi:hypothetical protein